MQNSLALIDQRIGKLIDLHESAIAHVDRLTGKMDSFNERISGVEDRLDRFTTIDSGQARVLQREASRRIRQLLPDEEQYKVKRPQYYSWLWRTYQDAFGVASYRDTRLKHFDAAIDWLREWRPVSAASNQSA
ncbi:ORF6C domain-containing protein [Alicyclobacillus sp. SO9]|uniref:ORF6C domain-containing protein n=1 Tax=Alicyclobacillus sp. SO9 TaxID=2665646 RepID=UPI0018E70808|nr:ORF6C domain-containing protein [Alicyclobacillus sp. SO9]QQE81573.1 ORF6C domain-containing protein [Alicyclobacillus sp. SO9]